MTTWVLILTIFGSEGSASIDHVPGFESQAVCMAAGKLWDGGIRSGFFESRRTSYVCVQTKIKVEQ